MQLWPYFNIFLFAFLIGSSMVATRFSVGQFEPLTFVGLRFLIAGLAYLMLLAVRARRHGWPRDRFLWKHAALVGLFGTAVPTISIVTAMQHLSSGLTAVLQAAIPAATVVLAHFFLPDERLSLNKGLGVTLAFGGAVLLAVRNETGLDGAGGNAIGYAYVFTAIIALSTMTVYVRRFMREMPPLEVAAVRVITGGVAMQVVILLTGGYTIDPARVNAYGWTALLYSTLMAGFFGMILEVTNIQNFGASKASIVSYLIPIVAGLGGILLLGETVTVGIAAGVVLILGGISLINRAQPTLPEAPPVA